MANYDTLYVHLQLHALLFHYLTSTPSPAFNCYNQSRLRLGYYTVKLNLYSSFMNNCVIF